jgi:hypothetical protein
MWPGIAINHCLPTNASEFRGRELHENTSHWCSVCNFDWLQLPYPAAGDAESVHLKGMFLPIRSQFAD